MTRPLIDEFTSKYVFSLSDSCLETIRDNLSDSALSYIFLDKDDKPVGAFGLVQMWKGVGEVWLLSTEDLSKAPVSLVRILRETIRRLMLNMRRVQMTVKMQELRHVRFAEALGFTIEGILVGYGVDGSNHYMMARYA